MEERHGASRGGDSGRLKMKIPKSFHLMGRTWKVRVVPKGSWNDDGKVGVCSFEKCEIEILQRDQEAMEQVLLHEYTHAALEAMASKLYDKENFVDVFASILHQILKTAK